MNNCMNHSVNDIIYNIYILYSDKEIRLTSFHQNRFAHCQCLNLSPPPKKKTILLKFKTIIKVKCERAQVRKTYFHTVGMYAFCV